MNEQRSSSPKQCSPCWDAEELQALVAHEVGHEYVDDDYKRAFAAGDRRRLKDLELLCDAIGIVTLLKLQMDPSRLITGADIIARDNRSKFGTAGDQSAYPTMAERRQFARAVAAGMKTANASKISNWVRFGRRDLHQQVNPPTRRPTLPSSICSRSTSESFSPPTSAYARPMMGRLAVRKICRKVGWRNPRQIAGLSRRVIQVTPAGIYHGLCSDGPLPFSRLSCSLLSQPAGFPAPFHTRK